METVRHVVAGTDFSEAAQQAVEVALGLARSAGARLSVVHVCEPGVEDPDDLHRCSDALSLLVARLPPILGGVAGVLRQGKPWEKLDNVAAEVGAGLIVIGRHGAGRGPVVAMGCVADHLVRTASRPVLTVPTDLTRLDVEALTHHVCGKR